MRKVPFFCQVEVALESFRLNGEETLQKNPVKKKFHPCHEETIKKGPECTCSGEYICNASEIQTESSPRSERPFQR